MSTSRLDMSMPPSLAAVWDEFIDMLNGPDGCNFQEVNAKVTWTCKGGEDRPLSRRLLTQQFGLTDKHVEDAMAYFSNYGGHCDCEIIFNVTQIAEAEMSK